jgi:flagellar biosynthetic protein FlhB
MTKQEVKNENKQTEGDPLLKGKIRERQRSVANMRMMKKIPEADFVVRNPTHYAVAIKYDPESKKHKAPVVIAKGRGYIALKIIEIAEQNKVTVTENRLLARALYKSVKVGREIPSEFYQAVAELLAFVYNLKKRERLYEVKE